MSEYGKIHTDGSRSGGQPLDDSIEAKALALLNEVAKERGVILNVYFDREITTHEALCRAIEQHEAFKQEVSDIVGDTLFMLETHCDAEALELASNRLRRLRIPKPKPDPLVEVIEAWFSDFRQEVSDAASFRAALESRGLEIREKGQ